MRSSTVNRDRDEYLHVDSSSMHVPSTNVPHAITLTRYSEYALDREIPPCFFIIYEYIKNAIVMNISDSRSNSIIFPMQICMHFMHEAISSESHGCVGRNRIRTSLKLHRFRHSHQLNIIIIFDGDEAVVNQCTNANCEYNWSTITLKAFSVDFLHSHMRSTAHSN